jgi:hypothetical protein
MQAATKIRQEQQGARPAPTDAPMQRRRCHGLSSVYRRDLTVGSTCSPPRSEEAPALRSIHAALSAESQRGAIGVEFTNGDQIVDGLQLWTAPRPLQREGYKRQVIVVQSARNRMFWHRLEGDTLRVQPHDNRRRRRCSFACRERCRIGGQKCIAVIHGEDGQSALVGARENSPSRRALTPRLSRLRSHRTKSSTASITTTVTGPLHTPPTLWLSSVPLSRFSPRWR